MIDKRVVITGGAGFIGSHLAEELANNNQVVIIDNLNTGSIENIGSLIEKENVTLIKGNIQDLPLLRRLFREVDFVFHKAAITSVPYSIKDPETTNHVNITGTLNVLQAARVQGVKKVIYASSASVYGDTPSVPHKEDMIPNPQSPYALTKLVGEYYCKVFHQIYGIPTISLRYFNVYGPRNKMNSSYAAVIPKFIDLLLKDKPPVIYGDGEQTRDFVYVKDVVRANIMAAESDNTGIVNIGQGEAVSINCLIKTIMEIMGKDVNPTHETTRPGDIRQSLADISKAKAMGFKPQYSLKNGLRALYEDYLSSRYSAQLYEDSPFHKDNR